MHHDHRCLTNDWPSSTFCCRFLQHCSNLTARLGSSGLCLGSWLILQGTLQNSFSQGVLCQGTVECKLSQQFAWECIRRATYTCSTMCTMMPDRAKVCERKIKTDSAQLRVSASFIRTLEELARTDLEPSKRELMQAVCGFPSKAFSCTTKVPVSSSAREVAIAFSHDLPGRTSGLRVTS